jgi:hypothetical protein
MRRQRVDFRVGFSHELTGRIGGVSGSNGKERAPITGDVEEITSVILDFA